MLHKGGSFSGTNDANAKGGRSHDEAGMKEKASKGCVFPYQMDFLNWHKEGEAEEEGRAHHGECICGTIFSETDGWGQR